MDHANTAIAGAAANVSAEHRLRMDEIETAMQAVLVELSSTHQDAKKLATSTPSEMMQVVEFEFQSRLG